ncbi:MAG: TAXI family TRAP transporter solute-binding subunit [Betaproteobacteria bacterium]
MNMQRRTLSLVAAATACVFAGCTALSVVLKPVPLTIATGTPGSIYHPVGNAICRLFNLTDAADVGACIAVSSEGSLANLQRIGRGKTKLGLAQSDVAYAAFRGEGAFSAAGANTNLRSLIALHSESFTIVARADSGIRDFQDLRGKRVGLGTSGAGYAVTRDTVLEFYGWTISDFDRLLEVGPAEQNRTLCDNIVDAIIFEAGHPNGLTQEATSQCHAKLVRVSGPPIDRLVAAHPYFVGSFIPGGLYAGNPDDVPTFGTRTLLLTSARLSDDLAYALVKAVFGNFDDFRRLHPALLVLKLEDMVPSEAVIPIHPGALRYYREVGLIR